MSRFHSLFRVELRSHHLRPGRTKHTLIDGAGARDFPPFKALEIAKYPEDQGFYLLYEAESGHGTDTWHLSLEDAMDQAEWEFGVTAAEWVKTDKP